MRFETGMVVVCSFFTGALASLAMLTLFVVMPYEKANAELNKIVMDQSCALVWSQPRLQWLYPSWSGWFAEARVPILTTAQYEQCRELPNVR